MKAAVYGTVAGILFGLSAALTKPTLDYLHAGVSELFTNWEPYTLAIAGMLGFVLQQVSLGTGRLAPSVATVSVANPVVGILLGVLLFDERLSRPAWHVAVACIGLGMALAGAVLISLARESRNPRNPGYGRRRSDRLASDGGGEAEALDQALELPRALRGEPGLVPRRMEARRRVGDDEGDVRCDCAMGGAAASDRLEVRAQLRLAGLEATTLGERRRVGGHEQEASDLGRQPGCEGGAVVT